MDALSFSGKTSISQNVIKGKMVLVPVPEGTVIVLLQLTFVLTQFWIIYYPELLPDALSTKYKIRIDLCGGTEVSYRDGMDGTYDIE